MVHNLTSPKVTCNPQLQVVTERNNPQQSQNEFCCDQQPRLSLAPVSTSNRVPPNADSDICTAVSTAVETSGLTSSVRDICSRYPVSFKSTRYVLSH